MRRDPCSRLKWKAMTNIVFIVILINVHLVIDKISAKPVYDLSRATDKWCSFCYIIALTYMVLKTVFTQYVVFMLCTISERHITNCEGQQVILTQQRNTGNYTGR